MKTTNIICDSCKKGIEAFQGYDNAYLTLVVSHIEQLGNICFCINWEPLLEGEKHFCGLKCLENWIKSLEVKKEEKK